MIHRCAHLRYLSEGKAPAYLGIVVHYRAFWRECLVLLMFY